MNLSIFDWINPLQATASGVHPISCYWSAEPPAHYEMDLAGAGIKVLGRVVTDSGFIIFGRRGCGQGA